MTGKIRNTASILLLVILMLPLAIKVADGLFHEHDHFVCQAKHEHHFHEDHQICPVCSYEFPLYLSEKPVLLFTHAKFIDTYLNAYQSACFSCPDNYLFCLRAPPAFNFCSC